MLSCSGMVRMASTNSPADIFASFKAVNVPCFAICMAFSSTFVVRLPFPPAKVESTCTTALMRAWTVSTWKWLTSYSKINGWNLKITKLRRNIIFQTAIFGFNMLIFKGVTGCEGCHLKDASEHAGTITAKSMNQISAGNLRLVLDWFRTRRHYYQRVTRKSSWMKSCTT